MEKGVLLDDYAYMSDPENATAVYEFLNGTRQPQMPIGGPFLSAEQLQLFSDWMITGHRP